MLSMNREDSVMPAGLFPPPRWWLFMGVILLIAAGLRLTGYNFSLPYIDHPDEPNFNLAARSILDVGSARPLSMESYPPGIITINYLFLRFLADPELPPGSIIAWVRLVSVAAGLATVLIAALLADRASGQTGGLVAGLLCAVFPVLIEHSRFATADALVGFFSLLALYQVMTGAEFNRQGWINAGFVSCMIAVTFKYQAIFLLPILLAIALLSWRQHHYKGRALWNRASQVAFPLSAFLFWLIALYPTLNVNSIPNWVAPTDRVALPNAQISLANLQLSLQAFWINPLWWIGGAGVLWSLISSRFAHQRRSSLMIIAYTAAWFLGVSLFGIQDDRQFITFMALVCTLVAIGITALIHEILHAAERFAIKSTIAHSLAFCLVILMAAPYLPVAARDAYQHTLHDRRNDLARWMDTTLAPGGYIADVNNHKTFNRSWGGYPGINEYPFIEQAAITERPVEAWRDMGVRYAIVPYGDFLLMQETPAGQAILQETTVLKTYPDDPSTRGPAMVVLLLDTLQHTVNEQLGSIRLVGYDISESRARTGDTLTMNYAWQAVQPPDGDYRVFNHLLDADDQLISQIDGTPLPDVRRPTSTWDDPSETLISQVFSLHIPDNATPGIYRLITGFYRESDGVRLAASSGETALLITTIEITGS